jgi:hypothetical protein
VENSVGKPAADQAPNAGTHAAKAVYRLITVEGRNTDIKVRVLAAEMGSWYTAALYISIRFKS